MAYSDYGGYAYRNGILVIERSDASIGKRAGRLLDGQEWSKFPL